MATLNIAHLHQEDTPNREISWFAQMVERGREALFTEVVSISPEIAERLLERNDCNRSTNERQIAAIAKDIANGLWQVNGETIIVSRDGQLNDGQNRLYAVIRAGITIETCVAFGASRESRFTVDMGRQRRAADFLQMHNVKYSHNVAAIVKQHQLYLHGIYRQGGSGQFLTKQELLRAYEARAKEYDRATERAARGKQLKSYGASPIGAAYMILHAVNPLECNLFFDRIEDGVGLERGSAILAVRNKLSNTAKRLTGPEKLELLLRGWNAWREGRINPNAPPITGNFPKLSR